MEVLPERNVARPRGQLALYLARMNHGVGRGPKTSKEDMAARVGVATGVAIGTRYEGSSPPLSNVRVGVC